MARVRAVFRRMENYSASSPEIIRAADLTLDLPRMRVTAEGREIEELTPTEFQLLAALARYPGRVFTRAQLLDAVHGVAFESYERAIDAHIKNIRHKIEPNPTRAALSPDGLWRGLQIHRPMTNPTEGPSETPPEWNSRHYSRRFFKQRPSWWPENEPWPPQRGRSRHHRFSRRLGCFFAFVILFLCGFFFVSPVLIGFLLGQVDFSHLSCKGSLSRGVGRLYPGRRLRSWLRAATDIHPAGQPVECRGPRR